MAVLLGYQAEIISEVDLFIAGRSVLEVCAHRPAIVVSVVAAGHPTLPLESEWQKHPDRLDTDIAVPPSRVSVLRNYIAAAQDPRGAQHCCAGVTLGQRGGRRSRAKGDIKTESYLSGASRFRGSGPDIDIYPFRALVAEVKSHRAGAGFVTLEKWLGEYDCLFLRRNSTEPMVLLPWRVWAALLARVHR